MSYNSRAKVNPFLIQDSNYDDEEYAWDDEEDDACHDDSDEDEDYGYGNDDEQQMLMSNRGNQRYNSERVRERGRRYEHEHSVEFSVLQGGRQSYHNHGGHKEERYSNGSYHPYHGTHTPVFWKYGLLTVGTIALAMAFGAPSFSVSFSPVETSDVEGNAGFASGGFASPSGSNRDDYRIVVLGERHSGTHWMRDRLRECFPDVSVSSRLQRQGYLFQDDEATARSKWKLLQQKKRSPASSHGNEENDNSDNNNDRGLHHGRSASAAPDTRTIVVHVTLNAYDWLERMRLSPEYAPAHIGSHPGGGHPVPLPWSDFLSKPWTMERPEIDLEFENSTGPVCQMGFAYQEVVSCRGRREKVPEKSQRIAPPRIGDPVYELQPGGLAAASERNHTGGTPFPSLIDLRAAKLKNHANVVDSWPSVAKRIHVQYESTAEVFRTTVVGGILETTGWQPPSSSEDSWPCLNGFLPPPSLGSPHQMTEEYARYVTDRIDWDTERAVANYAPWSEEILKGLVASSSTLGDEQDGRTSQQPGEEKEEEETVPISSETAQVPLHADSGDADRGEEKSTTTEGTYADQAPTTPESAAQSGRDKDNSSDESPKLGVNEQEQLSSLNEEVEDSESKPQKVETTATIDQSPSVAEKSEKSDQTTTESQSSPSPSPTNSTITAEPVLPSRESPNCNEESVTVKNNNGMENQADGVPNQESDASN